MTVNNRVSILISKYRTIIRKADKYNHNMSFEEIYLAKECAIIAVNELITTFSAYKNMYDQDFFDDELNYWQEVKKELEKL